MFRRFMRLKRVHFIGIGGAGMSGIAEVLADYDIEVTGSDLALGKTTARLERAGAKVFEGHDAAHVEGADLVVVSSAVPEDNVERLAARRLGVPVVRRAEMLGELMRLKYGIAVAGTHGKTTTTSMVGAILTDAGLDPTVIVGGRLRVSGTGARLGRSEYLVAEADEYDRSFLRLQPIIAVITSIDRDHLDTYGDLEGIERAFLSFADKVPFFGQLIVCLDDENVQRILPALADHRVVTYGSSPQAELRAVDVEPTAAGSRFGVVHGGRGELGTLEVPMPGRHNAHNALAAAAVGLGLGLEFPAIAAALGGFGGVHRRFERLGAWRGAHVVDDYAHHPTEVAATLAAAREAYPQAVIHAVFQPHLFSRTRDLHREFGSALLAADEAWVTEIYASRERPLAGVTAELVVEAARRSGHRHCRLCADWRELPARLAPAVGPGDLILTLGAGDIYRLAEQLAAEEAA
ncbi:MAG: UDP-N-acetylmuramate--L-alanine ligase [Acidobacteriota bacterium]|nr:UDP-N-acetylmuramate--L-alanine ligase [Acidobacteriota bacterium]MDH3522008.1 UDP-N-acetylmuramate--L-alanine ligase [Acidobacteriota bacterium]